MKDREYIDENGYNRLKYGYQEYIPDINHVIAILYKNQENLNYLDIKWSRENGFEKDFRINVDSTKDE